MYFYIFTKHYQIAEALANNHLQPNGVDFNLSDNLSIDTYKQKFIYQPQKSEGYAVDVPAILGNIYEIGRASCRERVSSPV